MVMDSISKFTIVLPVPVTAFSHTVPIDISSNATDIIRTMGTPSVMKAACCL